VKLFRRPAVRALLAVAALGVTDALVVEPHLLLFGDHVRIGIAAAPVRVVHLSDLHIAREEPLLRRLLKEVAAAHPDVILLSGDLVRDVPDLEPFARHTAAATAFISQLRAITPSVYAVQGHSEYQGLIVSSLADAGVRWLSNQGVRIGRERPFLLLGLNQQVGEDAYIPHFHPPFRMALRGGPRPRWRLSGGRGLPFKDFYLHYDPAPHGLADEGGALAWSGYEMLCDTWIENPDVGAGIDVHSRYVLGEDRMLRLRRIKAEGGRPGTFWLIAQGTTLAGHPDTGVDPEPGRWYRLRMKTAVEPDRVRVFARVWPVGAPEPQRWQAWGEDRTPQRIEAGTVGLGAWGGGTVLYRNLRVTTADGRVLLQQPFADPQAMAGWLQGARGTRLALALARSPEVPPGTPRVVLSHVPDVAPEASRRGIEVVLAGHTHGGQVALPFVGALTTRSRIGAYYDHGLFQFAAPNDPGWTTLFINQGVGTSLLPLRFWCPPRWALVELGQDSLPGSSSPSSSSSP
jgi:predicted MPP superfamily phosphohydrolase